MEHARKRLRRRFIRQILVWIGALLLLIFDFTVLPDSTQLGRSEVKHFYNSLNKARVNRRWPMDRIQFRLHRDQQTGRWMVSDIWATPESEQGDMFIVNMWNIGVPSGVWAITRSTDVNAEVLPDPRNGEFGRPPWPKDQVDAASEYLERVAGGRVAREFRWIAAGVDVQRRVWILGWLHNAMAILVFVMIPLFLVRSVRTGLQFTRVARNVCVHCKYDMTGLESMTCPECGHSREVAAA